MIDKHDLETKDFSLCLPELIGKIQAIGSSLVNLYYLKEFIPSDSFWLGFGTILNEVTDDLRKIDEALNPPSDDTMIGCP